MAGVVCARSKASIRFRRPENSRPGGKVSIDSFYEDQIPEPEGKIMRTRSRVVSATLISASVLTFALIALASDPFVGTWKMNPATGDRIL